MLIYFEGPPEYQAAALAASQYDCTKWVPRSEEADAFIVVWDGTSLRPWPRATLTYVYRIPREDGEYLMTDEVKQCGACQHWKHVFLAKGICDHPDVPHQDRGLGIYEEDAPHKDCPLLAKAMRLVAKEHDRGD